MSEVIDLPAIRPAPAVDRSIAGQIHTCVALVDAKLMALAEQMQRERYPETHVREAIEIRASLRLLALSLTELEKRNG